MTSLIKNKRCPTVPVRVVDEYLWNPEVMVAIKTFWIPMSRAHNHRVELVSVLHRVMVRGNLNERVVTQHLETYTSSH